jgi:hypothetical protein
MQSWTSGILAGFPAAERKYTTAADFQAVARRTVLRRQNSGQQAHEDKTIEISLQDDKPPLLQRPANRPSQLQYCRRAKYN